MCARAISTALLAAVLASGCEGAPPPQSSPAAPPDPAPSTEPSTEDDADAVVILGFDRIVSHDALEIEWLELADSRCPRGVVCVWEGEAIVTIEVTAEGEEGVSIELKLRSGVEQRPVEAAGHRFVLLSVEPYPRDGVTPDRADYSARIRVSPM